MLGRYDLCTTIRCAEATLHFIIALGRVDRDPFISTPHTPHSTTIQGDLSAELKGWCVALQLAEDSLIRVKCRMRSDCAYGQKKWNESVNRNSGEKVLGKLSLNTD